MDSRVMRKRAHINFIVALIAACSCLIGFTAQAAEVPWPAKSRFQYVAQKKDLRELLREFSVSQGITVSVAEGVEGSVSGKFDLKPQAMLDLLAASHGFLWYYDGSLLHITPSSNVRTEVIQLRFGNIDQLQATLGRLGILDPRYPLHVDTEGSTMVVSGPGRYVELVMQIAENLEGKQSRSQATEVRVFPLRFAWASDHEFSSGGQTVVVSGVASVLRSMYQAGNAGMKRAASSAMQKITAMKAPQIPTGTSSSETTAVTGTTPSAKTGAAGKPWGPTGIGGITDPADELPMIQADPRINAVLIRDIGVRMKQYESLIAALDIRPAMIEIEARIIEISSEEAEKLGVDWRYNGTPTANTANSLSRLSDVRTFTAGGGVFKTVLANAGLNLMERISALEQQGKANVTASPTVLTLNNLEARMDNQESFYVRVAGYQSAELFNITAGVTLRVTPLIVSEGELQRIKLDVRIEDGRINAQTVDQIPTVKRSEINTQGFVNDGEALLIAGYALEQESRGETGVPGLSKIPLLGALFRHQEASKTKLQRMFLLTPRIVNEESNRDRAGQVLATALGKEVAGVASAKTEAVNSRQDSANPHQLRLALSQNLSIPPLPVALKSAEIWEVTASDKTLRSTITRWSAAAGWQLSWELPIDYEIEVRTSITGGFEEAVEAVAKSLEKAEVPMHVILYKGNKVLRIVAKGNE